MSLPQQAGFSLAADLAIHARAPVLALPEHGRGFSCRGDVVIAWNGSRECAHALRLAMPLICRGLKAHVVTIAGTRAEMPADDAVHYIKQYGVAAIKHEIESNGQTIAEALLAAAKDFDAYYVVAGAYGHSRLREAVIGGTTRDLLEASDIPLFLAH